MRSECLVNIPYNSSVFIGHELAVSIIFAINYLRNFAVLSRIPVK